MKWMKSYKLFETFRYISASNKSAANYSDFASVHYEEFEFKAVKKFMPLNSFLK